jgi:hypothetical protein
MSKQIDLSDETIEKLAEAIRGKIVPLTYPTYIDLTYRPVHPYYHPYPFVTSSPNSGSVSGSSYGSQVYNG